MMETNTMNELGLGLKTVQSAVEQLHAAPISVVLVVALVLAGVAIRVSHAVPNRWAPWTIVASGTLSYMFLGDPGKVDPGQRFPLLVLGLYGFMLGMFALGIYAVAGKRIEKLFPQFDDNAEPSKPHNNENQPKQ